MPRLIRRDPFAREELHRYTQHLTLDSVRGCDNCGTLRRTKTGNPYLFVYYTETDSGRSHTHKGEFCSVSCRDACHR